LAAAVGLYARAAYTKRNARENNNGKYGPV